MIISSQITRAMEFCCQQHEGQTRKATKIPYASHPVSVGFILQSAGYSEEVVIAGILHDVLEDTKVSEDYIEKTFGKRVLELIKGVTEDIKILSWSDKKEDYINNLKFVDNDTKAISAADLLDNCRSMIRVLNSGVNIWNAFTVSPEDLINYKKERLAVIQESLQNEITENIQSTIRELEKMK